MSKKEIVPTSTRRDLARTAVGAYTAAALGLPRNLYARAIRDPQMGGTSSTGTPYLRDTIAAEYYLDEERYLVDERLVADHFWQMVDHESRI